MKGLMISSLLLLSSLALSQKVEAPHFGAADVRVSASSQSQFMRPPSTRGDRYEVKNATMADLIGLAYGFNATKILDGPSWLEMDRFDVIAKKPAQTSPDAQKQMLQSLLADRFELVVHEDMKPSFNPIAGLQAAAPPRA